MADLAIEVSGSAADPYAASPTMVFDLGVRVGAGEVVQAMALRAQIRIEPQRRRYSEDEAERLADLFGEPTRWSETLHPFVFAHASTIVGRFKETSFVVLPVVCSYDFEVAASRYLHSIGDGEIPLIFLFNGTLFKSGPSGLVVEPIAWHTEAHFMLPVGTWRAVMDRYFPGDGWLRVHRDTIEALALFKSSQALPTFGQAIELLLKRAGEDG